MGNPAFELHEIFEHWKSRNTGGTSMESQREANTADGLARIRRAFRLVAELEDEVSRLEHDGVSPGTHKSTLNFCARAVIGVPGAWQSRPTSSHQFPEDKMTLLRSLGDLINMRSKVSVADIDAIPGLLGQIEELLREDDSLPFLLVQHMQRLIADIRTALSRVDEFGEGPIASCMLELAIATKAAEATSTSDKRSSWASFWDGFWKKSGELTAGALAGGAVALALGM